VGDRQVGDWVGDQSGVRRGVWPVLEYLGGKTTKRVIGIGTRNRTSGN
jgi:hypothetical protein